MRSLLSLVAGLLLACEHRTAFVEAGSGGDEPGTVERATLAVTIGLSPEDSALASLIGMSGGVLPGAQVKIVRAATGVTAGTGVTDAAGVVRFEQLLVGDYRVSVFRLLTPEEIATLVAANEEVTAFAGAGTLAVSPPSTETTLQAVANREPSSLVISEVSITLPRLPSGNWYYHGHYLEVYNNTDTTILLDGKIVVIGFFYGNWDANETFNCENMERWREDPNGIWTQRFVWAFPGSGGQYPLLPGEAAVVATDAIDHRTVYPDLPDLSNADFEFIGSADVDNPAVPNMVRLGREADDHGVRFHLTDETVLIANPVDVSALPRENVPGVLDPEHWRIPSLAILDVAALGPTPAVEQAILTGLGSPFCELFTHENFDRGWAPLVDSAILDGMQRRVIAIRDGRKVLQRTKVSALDFFSGPMTPGFILE